MSEFNITSSNTILYSERWHEAVTFYGDTLGLEISFRNEWFVEFLLSDGAHLSVADANHATIPAGHGAGITLSWKVTNLELASQHLAGQDIEISPINQRWGSDYVEFRDPDGTRIELWADRPLS